MRGGEPGKDWVLVVKDPSKMKNGYRTGRMEASFISGQ